MNPVEIGGKEVGRERATFIVAEVGSNHNRDLALARQLIEVAACSGVDAVKFQLFQAAWLYPANCGVVNSPVGPVDFYRTLEEWALPRDWIPELKHYAEQLGLAFICTPFHEEEVDYLASLNIPAFKIASPELNHLPLLRRVIRYRKPLICSTGLSTLGDIEETLHTVHQEWPEAALILLHCVSAYPLPPEEANLGVIQTLQRTFDVPVGFSDHTTDSEMVPAMAVAAGACLIEKHYTLSRALSGPDHPFSLEPEELATMVRLIRQMNGIEPGDRMGWVGKHFGAERVKIILGHGRKEIMPVERELYPNDKRSIHAIKEISPGERLSGQNIRILRSERNLNPGIHPRYWETVRGARAVQSIPAGEGVRWEHLLEK